MNAVLGSIMENLQDIRLIAEPTVDVFKNDRTNTGDSKEYTVGEFISRYLPSDFQVKRGKIFSRTQESNNIDCVVLAPNHPKLITPKREIILAEGVYAAIEVKPDISGLSDSGELLRGLLQIKSVKNLERSIEKLDLTRFAGIPALHPYFDKIPSILFAFRSNTPDKTVEFLIKKINDGTLKADELPDLIVTMDNGLIMYSPHMRSNPMFQHLSAEKKAIFSDEIFTHFVDTSHTMILALFLSIFLNFQAPTILTSRPILNDYLKDMLGMLIVKMTPLSLNPNKVVEIVMDKLIQMTNNPK